MSNTDHQTTLCITSLVIGAIYMTTCYHLPGLIKMPPLQHVLIALGILFPVTFLLVYLSSKKLFLIPIFIFAGVAVGVIADALLDPISRNLFPLEILWWGSLFAPAIGIGAAIGWFAKRHTS